MHQLHGFVLFSLKQMGGIQLKNDDTVSVSLWAAQ